MSAEPRRAGRWIPVVYYYLATVIGLVILLIGLIQGLQGLTRAAFPDLSPELRFFDGGHGFEAHEPPPGPEGRAVVRSERKLSARETEDLRREREQQARRAARLGGFADAVEGLIAAIVGGPVFFWHLRQARRKEPEWFAMPAPPAAGADQGG